MLAEAEVTTYNPATISMRSEFIMTPTEYRPSSILLVVGRTEHEPEGAR